MKRPVVICGLGRVGWRVFEFLKATGTALAVTDQNLDLADPRLDGVKAVRGDFPFFFAPATRGPAVDVFFALDIAGGRG